METALTDPDVQRWEVRSATYPNRQAEIEAVAAVDGRVFDRARILEDKLVADARDLEQRSDEHVAEAVNLTAELHGLRMALAGDDVDVEALAERYHQLRAQVQQSLGKIQRADRDAKWMLPKLADPWEAYRSVVSKFGGLLVGR